MANPINKKDLIITDFETTGTDFRTHEIIEIGAIRVDYQLNIIEEYCQKTKINHPELLTESAKRCNGYQEHLWKNSKDLEESIKEYLVLAKSAIFVAHNTTFDWLFLNQAMYNFKIKDTFDRYKYDIPTIFHTLYPDAEYIGVDSISKMLGLPEEVKPHAAINGVRQSLKILRRLKNLPIDDLEELEKKRSPYSYGQMFGSKYSNTVCVICNNKIKEGEMMCKQYDNRDKNNINYVHVDCIGRI